MRKEMRRKELHRRVLIAAEAAAANGSSSSSGNSAVLSENDPAVFQSHRLEHEVRSRLMSEPQLQFTSLVVRRLPDGLCLEGVVETSGDPEDVSELIRQICNVPNISNRLVVHRSRELPLKG
jgi:hypothetical protein